jgi:hypothetical protein
MTDKKPCPCGSGIHSFWQLDARGIGLCQSCERCHEQKPDRRLTERELEKLVDSLTMDEAEPKQSDWSD